MIRLIMLIILFLIMVFTVIAELVAGAGQTGVRKAGPIEQLGKDISKSLNKADRIAPDLAKTLDGVDIKLPSLTKQEEAPTMARQDYAGKDFTGGKHAEELFSGSTVSEATFTGALLDGAI
ncbi:MAG: hypothetical protein AAFQ96_02505, partial [Pseudomonadota bacterium]